MRTFIILSVAICACLSSCRNGSQERTAVEAEVSNDTLVTMTQNVVTECMDTTVIVTETDHLTLYKPIFYGGVELSHEPLRACNRVFMAAAAYTKTYNWTEFSHDLIAGPHIAEKFYEGYDEPANSGAFYFKNSSYSWGFVHDGFENTLKEVAAKEEVATGFSQVMLVYDGSACSIHPNARPRKLALRRALCELDGELYIIDSKREVTMYNFIESLLAQGVKHALYMDMGGMKYSLYKEYYDGEWIEIHPANANTKYCTNYLVFYYVN